MARQAGWLGRREFTLLQDLDQAEKMLKLRIKIDVWSCGIKEATRQQIRENLCELYCQLPSRRVWFYLKHVRHMKASKKGKDDEDLRLTSISIDAISGSEDIIAQCKTP